MSVGAIGGISFPYSTAMNSGPTVAPQTQEAVKSDLAAAVQGTQLAVQQIASGNITPTRGQNLNVVI
jgi:hypothetical protein